MEKVILRRELSEEMVTALPRNRSGQPGSHFGGRSHVGRCVFPRPWSSVSTPRSLAVPDSIISGKRLLGFLRSEVFHSGSSFSIKASTPRAVFLVPAWCSVRSSCLVQADDYLLCMSYFFSPPKTIWLWLSRLSRAPAFAGENFDCLTRLRGLFQAEGIDYALRISSDQGSGLVKSGGCRDEPSVLSDGPSADTGLRVGCDLGRHKSRRRERSPGL